MIIFTETFQLMVEENKDINLECSFKNLKQLGEILVRERTEIMNGTMEKVLYRHGINNYI